MTAIEAAKAALTEARGRLKIPAPDMDERRSFRDVEAALSNLITEHERVTSGDTYAEHDAKHWHDRYVAGEEIDRLTTPPTDDELAQALYRTLYDAGVSFESASLIPRLTATVRAVVQGGAKLPQNSDDEREQVEQAARRLETSTHLDMLALDRADLATVIEAARAGFHRQGPTTPPSDDEREALALAGLDSERLRQIAEWLRMEQGHEETAGRVDLIADRHDRLAGFRRQEPITDAVVVDALSTFYGDERDTWSMDKVRRMRAALEAARAS
jgi:hypothetical protein